MILLEQRYAAGFVVLSYAIAFIGSICTLELLIRRTSNRGMYNVLLLASAGICFGAVSTFSMHFVGNQSLSLHHPQQKQYGYPTLFLSYDAGFSILSLVVSCFAMIFAFFVMASNFTSRQWVCMPGKKKRRRTGRRGSSHDEYGAYLMSKAAKKSAGFRSLVEQAKGAAAWSLIDSASTTERRGWRQIVPSKKAAAVEPVDDINFSDDEEAIIRSSKQLSDIEFRLGRNAVREELDRRQGTCTSLGSSPVSLRHMSSEASLNPTSPLAVYYPPHRRGSMPQMTPTTADDSFSGYAFPQSRPTAIEPAAEPAPTWPTEAAPAMFDPSLRRASLPVAVCTRAEAPVRPPVTLSRIQSLPEPDVEMSPTSSVVGHDKLASPPQEEVVLPARQQSPESSEDEPPSGWRTTLRYKVANNIELTRLEAMERFMGLDVVTMADIFKITITGMIAGWGVCGMHYIGQVSINDIPYIAYHPGYVVGSVVIASGAVIVALYIMFIMLRPKLKHSWASKVGVGIILAGAVCGMHYTASEGTIYGWPVSERPTADAYMNLTKRMITGLVAALAFLACIAVFIFVWVAAGQERRERARRRRVVVASIIFNHEGRILVNPTDGLVPMCDIASTTTEQVPHATSRSFASESTVLTIDLSPSHDAFVQALKASWGWKTSVAYKPVPEQPTYSRRGSAITADSSVSSGQQRSLTVNSFVERFQTASRQLATRITGDASGVGRLGVLFDQILTTGWVSVGSNDSISKGQLIFLVRRVERADERSDLLSRQFIFAEPHAVAAALTKTLSTPIDAALPFLDNMRAFCDDTVRMPVVANTLYAGVVLVQATPFDGLRILTEQMRHAQLPMREICTFASHPGMPLGDELGGSVEEIGEALTWLDGMSLLSVIKRNMATTASADGPPRVALLLAAIERALVPLLDSMLSPSDMAYIIPRLLVHPVLVPLTPNMRYAYNRHRWASPHALVVYANYDVAQNTFSDRWLPFSLFRTQQECVLATRLAELRREHKLADDAPGNGPGTGPGTVGAPPTPDMYARRPSRVQFDFSSLASPAPGSPALASPATIDAPAFGGYTFPPRQPVAAPTTAASATPAESPSPASPGQPIGPVSPMPVIARLKTTTAAGAGGAPRRSSLAKSAHARPDDDYAKGADTRASGVAAWDPNWLAALLRYHLGSANHSIPI
ncbi:hypothetical protein Q5752_005698 [Cryptotrichosporon argae]